MNADSNKSEISIAILSPCGWGNLGDAAVQDSILQEIYRRYPNAKVQGITLNPADTEARHNIPASTTIGFEIIPGYGVREKHLGTPAYSLNPMPAVEKKNEIETSADEKSLKEKLRKLPFIFVPLHLVRKLILPLEVKLRKLVSEIKHMRRSIQRLREIDLLIASGGGQFDDEWGGAWGHPYALARWSFLAWFTSTPFKLLSIGTCGLDLKVSFFFIRIIRRFANYCSFRDQGSKDMVLFCSRFKDDPVFPDLAFGLKISENYIIEEKSRPYVGVSPISYCDPRIWPKKSSEIYNGILNKQAKTVEFQLNKGNDIVMIAADLADKRAIIDLMEILKDRLTSEQYNRVAYPNEHTVECLTSYWSEARFVIASRLHGVLLSYVCHTPVIALSYDRKVTALAQMMKQDDYLFDIKEFTADDLIEKTVKIEEERESIITHIKQQHIECIDSLQRQYDNVLRI